MTRRDEDGLWPNPPTSEDSTPVPTPERVPGDDEGIPDPFPVGSIPGDEGIPDPFPATLIGVADGILYTDDMSLCDVDITVRAANHCAAEGLRTVRDVRDLSLADLIRILGNRKTAKNVWEGIRPYGATPGNLPATKIPGIEAAVAEMPWLEPLGSGPVSGGVLGLPEPMPASRTPGNGAIAALRDELRRYVDERIGALQNEVVSEAAERVRIGLEAVREIKERRFVQQRMGLPWVAEPAGEHVERLAERADVIRWLRLRDDSDVHDLAWVADMIERKAHLEDR